MIRAVTYIRMSTTDQDTSPAQQRKELTARFGKEYEIVGEYLDEGKSGSKDVEKRTQFMKLLADAEKGLFQVVLCYDLSRFSRLDTIEAAFAKKTLRDNGIRLVTVLEGQIDWNSSTGRIVDSVLSEAQHEYSVKLARNTLRGKLDRAKKGQTYGQLTPYGLARQLTDPQGSTRIVMRTERFRKPEDWLQVFVRGDEREAAIVERLFSDFYRRDVSFHQLARELNLDGVPSPNGGKWVYQTIIQILTNVRYVGDLSIGNNGAGKFFRLDGENIVSNTEKRMRTNKPNRLVIQNTHQGIIDRPLFERVQEKVKRRWKSGKHSCREEGFALTGVLYCGGCGKPLFGNDGTTRAKARDGVKYSCKGDHRTPGCGCGQWGVHEDEILPFLVRVLLERIDAEVLRRADAPLPRPVQTDTSHLERRLALLTTDYKRGLQRFLTLPDNMKAMAGDLDDQLKAWKTEIDALTEEIAAAKDADDSWCGVLRRRKEWWVTMRDKLIYVPVHGARVGNRRYSTGVRLSVSAIRELFHQMDCRLTLWWDRPADARQYRIVRGRLRAGEREDDLTPEQLASSAPAHSDHTASEIVWCGLRNGRTDRRAWPGGRWPVAE